MVARKRRIKLRVCKLAIPPSQGKMGRPINVRPTFSDRRGISAGEPSSLRISPRLGHKADRLTPNNQEDFTNSRLLIAPRPTPYEPGMRQQTSYNSRFTSPPYQGYHGVGNVSPFRPWTGRCPLGGLRKSLKQKRLSRRSDSLNPGEVLKVLACVNLCEF